MQDLMYDEKIGFSYSEWLSYFRTNDESRLNTDFSGEPALGGSEKALVFPSISAFQKGERSDGVYFAGLADRFAQKYGEADYPEAVRMFIREENYHSAYLAEYMKYHGVPFARESRLDRVFRSLRHKGGLYTEISVLLTAEIIALSYYSALGSTADELGSTALRGICAQMLHDELPHVVFQSYTLSHFRNGAARRAFRRILMEVTTLFVYGAFGKVMRRGGYRFSRFRRENIGYLKQSAGLIKQMKK